MPPLKSELIKAEGSAGISDFHLVAANFMENPGFVSSMTVPNPGFKPTWQPWSCWDLNGFDGHVEVTASP